MSNPVIAETGLRAVTTRRRRVAACMTLASLLLALGNPRLGQGHALVLATADSAQSPIVVFVHGRGQDSETINNVRNAFIAPFGATQRAWLGRSIVPDDALAFVWYADVIDKGAEPYPNAAAGACLGVEDQSFTESDRVNDWRIRLTNFAKGLGLDAIALKHFAGDTYAYLGNTRTRCEVEARLETELKLRGFTTRPIILVAHSMGGIVSFASLQKNAATIYPERRLRIERLVTIGTQIGVPLILEGIDGAYVTPPIEEPISISSWKNFMNSGDKLAFPTTKVFHATDSRREPVDFTIQVAGDRHASTTYLSNRLVVRAILWSWCKAFPAASKKPAECAQVEALGDI